MRITEIMIGKGFGGAERSFIDTSLALAERGYQVQAICHRRFSHLHLLQAVPNIELETVDVGGAWDFRAVGRMARAMQSFRPVVAHTHLARAAWLGGLAAHRAGVPCVAKLHNYAKLGYYRHIDHFVVTTPDQFGYLKQHGIDADSVSVIPNFSRIQPVAVPPQRTRNEVTFVTIGRLVPEKAYDRLIMALAELRRQNCPVRLLVGGDGPLKDELRQLSRQLQVDESVEWAGWVNDVESFLKRGDVFVLSSRSESFGIVLLEAMARGLPIVTTRTKGPVQVVSEECAWFAEPDDVVSLSQAMQTAATDPVQCQQKAGVGLQRYNSEYFEPVVIPRLESVMTRVATSYLPEIRKPFVQRLLKRAG